MKIRSLLALVGLAMGLAFPITFVWLHTPLSHKFLYEN
jgi:hypothetical protein